MGVCNAIKFDAIKECDRQLQQPEVYKKKSVKEMKKMIIEVQTELRGIVQRHVYKGRITKKKKKIFSKEFFFEVPIFNIWKKNSKKSSN